jgi:hypothetical protein
MTCCDKRSLRYVQALNQALRSCPQGPPFQAGGHARPALADGFQGRLGPFRALRCCGTGTHCNLGEVAHSTFM